MRGGSGRQPLPSVTPPVAKQICDLCEAGYARRLSEHDHRVLVRTPNGLLHCTVCHGRGRELSRV